MSQRNFFRWNQALGIPTVPVFFEPFFSLIQCLKVLPVGWSEKPGLFSFDFACFFTAFESQGFAVLIQFWLKPNRHHAVKTVFPCSMGRFTPCLCFDFISVNGLPAMNTKPDCPVHGCKIGIFSAGAFSLVHTISFKPDCTVFRPSVRDYFNTPLLTIFLAQPAGVD